MLNLRRVVWTLFPPEEVRQFIHYSDQLFSRREFQPRLHAPNPLIPLKQEMKRMTQKPDQLVCELKQLAIPVEHFVLLKIHHITLEMLNSSRLVEQGISYSGQEDELLRLLRQINRLMDLRGYSIHCPNVRIKPVREMGWTPPPIGIYVPD